MAETIDDILAEALQQKRDDGSFRSFPPECAGVDFGSNDYLGFSRSAALRNRLSTLEPQYRNYAVGSTGSRLISGNHPLYEEVENGVAAFHGAECGTIFNTGYVANLGFFSCVPQIGDTVFSDEHIHASVRAGLKLGMANSIAFRHNDVQHLAELLGQCSGNGFVAVDSVYSMNGDCCPLSDLVEVCERAGAYLVVDEAHATGVFGGHGRGLVCEHGFEDRIYARTVTFGKALGSHGAIVLGSKILQSYLINFSGPLFYSTALTTHTLLSIKAGYELLAESDAPVRALRDNITLFVTECPPEVRPYLIPSTSAIQGVVIPGNERVKDVVSRCVRGGFDLRAVLSPTVPQGSERIRICLHATNTKDEIQELLRVLRDAICSGTSDSPES